MIINVPPRRAILWGWDSTPDLKNGGGQMLGNFIDDIKYKKSTGRSKLGNIEYQPEEIRKASYVKGKDIEVVEGDKKVTKYKRIYHTPFEVKEGDMIDGHLVVDVRPSRDLRGKVYFWIVGVI